ncbi:WD40-repeat-containing domain protein [Polychytrium aggregatum]|uniref:WD40-repeat-containing domain protein n=1 Tax=Polychytrium aggregatum TaxID=110093 RepID=UPI0022FDF0BE|nr:WD40-repeat-containing domain protein [Polychytrium aggregatum]KAI9203003.1 WD40-repeat-containing domain protein [Polychytrium aggregatum]
MEVDTPEQRPQDTPAAQTPPAQPESQPAHAGGNPSATLAGAAIVEEELDTYLNPVSRETDGVILHDNDICYTVTPVVSAGHPCSVYCVAATRNMRWVYTGGDDGFIRKFDFVPSMNGDYPLPLNQRHGLADSIIRGGLLISAWENEETLPRPNAADSAPTENRISPVYSIDVHSEGAWVVTGCESGAINMWTGRHDEGTCFHTLQHHKNSVSVLKITPDETGLFSGSWDKSVLRWDLNVGRVVREFSGASSQITSISLRPTPNTGTGLPSRSTESILMCTSFDGCIGIFDERVPGRPQIRKILPQGSPPWALSACWSNDGKRIYCGRRNGTVDEYDFAEGKILRTLRLPRDSGAVSQVNIMPNDRHLLCASYDNIRLWDLQASESKPTAADSSVPSTPNAANPVTQSNRRLDIGDSACPFTIVPGHHGGVLSSLYIDASRKYLISASGARGWDGVSTNMCLFYDVKPQRQ